MSLIKSIQAELRDLVELTDGIAHAAGRTIRAKAAQAFNTLTEVNTKVLVLEVEAVKRARSAVAAAGKVDEAVLAELDAYLAYHAEQAAEYAKLQQQAKQNQIAQKAAEEAVKAASTPPPAPPSAADETVAAAAEVVKG